jgi:hypothetical protein
MIGMSGNMMSANDVDRRLVICQYALDCGIHEHALAGRVLVVIVSDSCTQTFRSILTAKTNKHGRIWTLKRVLLECMLLILSRLAILLAFAS